MLVLSTALYVNFESISLKQVYSNNMDILLQTSRGVSITTNTAMTLSNQIYSDLNVAKLLYYSDPEIADIRAVVDQLTNYRLTLPFIDSVYVYNGKNRTFYINALVDRNTTREIIQNIEEFDDRHILEIFNNYSSYKKYILIPRKFVVNEKMKKYKDSLMKSSKIENYI